MKKKWDLVDRETPEGRQALDMIEHVTNTWKDDLIDARIGAAWFIGRKPTNGHLLLGRMKVYGELERKQLDLDGQVQLNRDWWTWLGNTDEARLALVHHELCHMTQKLDSDGDQEVDGHGGLLWRKVRHDLEDFRAVVQVHGLWMPDVAAFAESLATGAAQMSIPGFETPGKGKVLEYRAATA